MKEQFRQYIIDLYKDVPPEIYEGLLAIFCLGIVVLIAIFGIKKGLRYSAGLLLFKYVLLLFCSTVFFRENVETRGHNFTPFWSYIAIQEGRAELLPENIMNVVVFVPVGILLGLMVQGSRLTVMKELLIALMVGVGISVSIEAMQYIFHRGFAETDDVMHNTVGCMLGYSSYRLLLMTLRYAK